MIEKVHRPYQQSFRGQVLAFVALFSHQNRHTAPHWQVDLKILWTFSRCPVCCFSILLSLFPQNPDLPQVDRKPSSDGISSKEISTKVGYKSACGAAVEKRRGNLPRFSRWDKSVSSIPCSQKTR